MNELTKELLEVAWKDMPAKQRSLDRLKCEVRTSWIIWRNHQVEDWGAQVLEEVQRRPATDYYPDTFLGASCIDWLDNHGFYSWEFPAYDGADDDFVYHFIAHWLAVMAWLAFEPNGSGRQAAWTDLDYTEAEIEEFFNFKMDYAPRPKPKYERQLKKVEGTQLTMF